MDEGHLETEIYLARIENRVNKVYRQAAEEVEKKLNDYLRRFKTKDQIKREQLRKGEITQDEYNYWRTGQIMIGKRWEEMKNTLAQDLHNSNNLARSIVQGYMPEVYAVNHNYATFQVEKDSLVDTSYTLYDRQTVERIIKDQPDLLPPPGPRKRAEIAAGKDIKWQRGQIQSTMMQSILQGESIPHIAQRMAKELSVKNRNSAVRYARTAATGAQNAGRVDGYKRAQGMGIELEQEWLATLDMRTRHEHRFLDGQHVPVGTPFKVDGEEIRFPGDPEAPGYLIWNCRCTLVPHLKNLDQSDAPRRSKLGDMSYEEWKKEHTEQDLTSPINIDNYTELSGSDLKKWAKSYHEFNDTIPDPYATRGRGYVKDSDSEYIYSHYVRSNESNRINKGLREGKLEEWRKDEWATDTVRYKTVDALDKAIAGNAFQQDTIVRRFVGNTYMQETFGSNTVEGMRDKIGSVFHNDQFMSTTVGYNKVFDKRPAIMSIACDKGTHAFPTTNYTEGEVILGRNTDYELIGVVDHSENPLLITHTNGKQYEYTGIEIIVHMLR